MKKATIEQLSAVRTHNFSKREKGVNTLPKDKVKEIYSADFGEFASQLFETRQGGTEDKFGMKRPPIPLTFNDALQLRYGTDVKGYLTGMGIHYSSDTLETVAKRFGLDHLTQSSLKTTLNDHSMATSLSGLMSTPDVNQYKFIIPELIISMINASVDENSFYSNWIHSTINVSKRKITVPIEKTGNVIARVIGEGESIPFGTVEFGDKEVMVEKIGIGMKFTDELLSESSLDMLALSLRKIGRKLNGTTNMYARQILINGDKTKTGFNSDESCAVVGTTSGTSFAWKDIKRVSSQMRMLGTPPNRLILDREDGIDVSGIDKFEGFSGATKLASLQSIIGVPDTLVGDTFPMPDNQIMFIDSKNAMVKLNYRGLRIESRRNPQNQTEEYFLSDYVGFAITDRSARVLLDKTVSWSATYGATGGFPVWMNIEGVMEEEFER